MALNFPYLHYRLIQYTQGKYLISKKLQSLSTADQRKKDVDTSVNETRTFILQQAVGKLQRINKNTLDYMSDVYSAFVFRNYTDSSEKMQKIKSEYNKNIIEEFQSMFKKSEIGKSGLITTHLDDSIAYKTFLSQNVHGLIDSGGKGIAVSELGRLDREINNLLDNLGRSLGKSATDYQTLNNISNRLKKLRSNIKSKNKEFSARTGRGGVFLNDSILQDELEKIITDYNILCANLDLTDKKDDQGAAGELLFAAIQYFINKGSLMGARKLLNESWNTRSKQIKNKKGFGQNKNNGVLWTAAVPIKTPDFIVDKNMFNLNELQKIFSENKDNSFDIKTGTIDLGESQSTADIIIDWPELQLKDVGVTIKNYRHGMNSSRFHILNEANLLAILQFTTTDFFYHFMHLTSTLHADSRQTKALETRAVNNSTYGWQQVKNTIYFAVLARGLAGIRSGGNGGEASIFIAPSPPHKKVFVISTLDVLESAYKQLVQNTEKLNGVQVSSLKRPLYDNKYVPDVPGFGSWLSARSRSTQYLAAIRNIKLSASINPSALQKYGGMS